MTPSVQIGKFTFWEHPAGGVWMEDDESGDGMQMLPGATLDVLVELLDKFWKEHF